MLAIKIVLLSLFLNVLIFSLIPVLSSDLSKKNIDSSRIFIKIPVIMRPLPQKNIKKIVKNKIKTKIIRPVTQPAIPQITRIQKVPYEINTKLSKGSVMLPSLPMARLDMSDFALKQIYEIHELDSQPMAIYKPDPYYPFRARRNGIEGKFKVRFKVNSHGLVEKVQIFGSENKNVFEKSITKALMSWKFSPGKIEGENVSCWYELPITFAL